MKIAQCLEYPLGLRGGVSVLVEVLAEQLAYNGHKIVLVSPDTRETLQRTGASKLIEEHIYWDPSSRLLPTLENWPNNCPPVELMLRIFMREEIMME